MNSIFNIEIASENPYNNDIKNSYFCSEQKLTSLEVNRKRKKFKSELLNKKENCIWRVFKEFEQKKNSEIKF
jgi:hypothetical protein